MYSSPATTNICLDNPIKVSLSKYTIGFNAFANSFDTNVFPQAGGDVTKSKLLICIPPIIYYLKIINKTLKIFFHNNIIISYI